MAYKQYLLNKWQNIDRNAIELSEFFIRREKKVSISCQEIKKKIKKKNQQTQNACMRNDYQSSSPIQFWSIIIRVITKRKKTWSETAIEAFFLLAYET